MYLIYNREYQLVGEANDFKQVKDSIGDDITEKDVDSLEFKRGKTVVTDGNLKRLIQQIVSVEKDLVVGYITSEIEIQEDETVELKTSNRHLQNQIHETKGYLAEVSSQIGKVLGDVVELPVNEPKITYEEEPDLEESYSQEKVTEEPDLDEGLDSETMSVLKHLQRGNKVGDATKPDSKKKSVSKIIPNRKKKGYKDINFISIIEGGKVAQIKDLSGKSMVKTATLADDVGLDREHVEYLIQVTLKECGGEPKYQNKSVVSTTEAVWIILSALTKREGFGNTQRFQKTKENAEDFYQAWESQKNDIEAMIG